MESIERRLRLYVGEGDVEGGRVMRLEVNIEFYIWGLVMKVFRGYG